MISLNRSCALGSVLTSGCHCWASLRKARLISASVGAALDAEHLVVVALRHHGRMRVYGRSGSGRSNRGALAQADDGDLADRSSCGRRSTAGPRPAIRCQAAAEVGSLDALGPDLDPPAAGELDRGVGILGEVVEPRGVPRRAAGRGDDQPRVGRFLDVAERDLAILAALRALRVEDDHGHAAGTLHPAALDTADDEPVAELGQELREGRALRALAGHLDGHADDDTPPDQVDDAKHGMPTLPIVAGGRRLAVRSRPLRARPSTASSIGGVRRPVKVFCWLGW